MVIPSDELEVVVWKTFPMTTSAPPNWFVHQVRQANLYDGPTPTLSCFYGRADIADQYHRMRICDHWCNVSTNIEYG